MMMMMKKKGHDRRRRRRRNQERKEREREKRHTCESDVRAIRRFALHTDGTLTFLAIFLVFITNDRSRSSNWISRCSSTSSSRRWTISATCHAHISHTHGGIFVFGELAMATLLLLLWGRRRKKEIEVGRRERD